MSMRSLRRVLAAGALVSVLAVSSAEAAPAGVRSAAPDLWAQTWEWVASWWNGLAGALVGEKSVLSDPTGAGTPLSPAGTTSTTTPPPTGTGEIGGHIDPNG